MTTISHLNVIIQQGSSIRDVVAERHQPQNMNQVALAQIQDDQHEAQRQAVQPSDESDATQLQREKSEKRRQGHSPEKQDEKIAKDNKKGAEDSGHLLDTIA